ncbi:MAG: SDR family oxidoreductase, partial [Burkholderiales bacterium]|nr:SDR family oxidoreductase [Burkholderiales bacterium]
CERLARAGAGVVVADLRLEPARETCARIRDQGGTAWAYAADVGDRARVEAMVRDIGERHGALDIVVNNAGIDVTLPIDELDVGDFDRVLQTNLRGPFLLSKFAAAQMRERGSGHIVNIASTAAKRAWPNASAYHASKWGLLGLSYALHAELRPYGIKVTAVIAGGMRTPFLLDRFPDIDPAVLQEPADVADAIVGILSVGSCTVIPEVMILPMRETSWP